jgi:hypothetical protein
MTLPQHSGRFKPHLAYGMVSPAVEIFSDTRDGWGAIPDFPSGHDRVQLETAWST